MQNIFTGIDIRLQCHEQVLCEVILLHLRFAHSGLKKVKINSVNFDEISLLFIFPKRLWTYHNFHQGWWNSYLEIYFKIFLYIFMSALSMRTTFALGKKCFPWKKIQFLLALSGIRTPKLQEPSLCYLADFFEYYVILVSLHPLCICYSSH